MFWIWVWKCPHGGQVFNGIESKQFESSVVLSRALLVSSACAGSKVLRCLRRFESGSYLVCSLMVKSAAKEWQKQQQQQQQYYIIVTPAKAKVKPVQCSVGSALQRAVHKAS